MEDLVVKMMRDMNGKDMFYRETCLNGLLVGLAVQTKLVTMGRTYYDGALLARIKSLEGKPVPVLIRSLEHDYSEKLFDSCIVTGKHIFQIGRAHV